MSMIPNPPLAPHHVRPGGRWLAVEVHDRLDSTNAEALRDPRLGRVITAEVQDRGRGRLGRGWATTPSTSLAVSVVTVLPLTHRGWVPLLTGLAVHDAIGEVAGLVTALKWPNDVLAAADGGKLAGILCESSGPVVVIGTGINVSSSRDELPVPTATSLALCGAQEVSRERLLTAYLTSLDHHLNALDTDPKEAHAAYRAACSSIGTQVECQLPDGSRRSGNGTGVDEEGRLMVATPTGTYAVTAGDVVHVRSARPR